MNNRRRVQYLAVLLLILFPIVMIVVNGSRALRGIVWSSDSHATQTSIADSPSVPAIEKVGFGVFDPDQEMANMSTLSVEQIYLSWADFDPDSLMASLDKIAKRHRWPLLTVEPWPLSDLSAETLFDDVTAGRYDAQLELLGGTINSFAKPLFLSWGHEMDQDLTERYPWSSKEPVGYIKAFRYAHDFISLHTSNDIYWVWSPVVKPTSQKYWPGEDVVDYVGFPLYSYPDWDLNYYGHIRTFSEVFENKHRYVSSFGKPIMIVEMGVHGSYDYKRYWLQEAFTSFQKYPLLRTVVFFNSADKPGAWGENLPAPDWRLSPEFISGFISWYLKQE